MLAADQVCLCIFALSNSKIVVQCNVLVCLQCYCYCCDSLASECKKWGAGKPGLDCQLNACQEMLENTPADAEVARELQGREQTTTLMHRTTLSMTN